MKIIDNLDKWRTIRGQIPLDTRIGFVPTMGNLHAGHASLYTLSCAQNDCTIASLFINPTQFNQPEDFANYPKTLAADFLMLTDLGVDYCLLPDEKSIYPDGYRYQIQENKLSQSMEGIHRPGHFTGMLTIVMKLLQLVKPQRAYFGEKDYQQYQLIQGMIEAFFMDIEIITCPTIREESGLAMSSRNTRLSKEEHLLADQFAQIFHDDIPVETMIQRITALGINVVYIEEHANRLYAAVQIGAVRLIDNVALKM